MRPRNFKLVYCSERSCGKPIPPGHGFYHGKRGVGRADYFLCVVCDAADKKVKQQVIERNKQLKLKRNAKQQPLFNENNQQGGCGCV